MKFVKPGDVDKEDSEEQDKTATQNQTTVSLAWQSDEEAEHTPASATEANATELQTVRETIDDLQELVDDQQEVITDQRSTIEDLHSETTQLTDRVADQESTIEDLTEELSSLRNRLAEFAEIESIVEEIDTRISQIETKHPDIESRVSDSERHLTRLRAAVLEEELLCPECETGHLSLKGGIVDPNTLVCDHCDYVQSTTIQ